MAAAFREAGDARVVGVTAGASAPEDLVQAVIARLESGRVKPSTRTLERLAAATGMRLRISFEPLPAK